MHLGNRQLLPQVPEDTVVRFEDTRVRPSTFISNLVLYMDRYVLDFFLCECRRMKQESNGNTRLHQSY